MEAATGLSLFQGSDGIQLNANVQCQEEEEAIEDERRRNEEIKNLLSTAFDDLSVDDDDDDYDENDCNGGSNVSSFHNNNNNGHSLNGDSSFYDNQDNSDCHVNKTNTYVTNNQKSTMDVNRTGTPNVDKNERDEFHFLSSLDMSPNDNNNHRIMFYDTYKKQRYQHTLPSINDSATEEMVSTPSVDADNSDNEKYVSSPHHLHCYRRTSLGCKGDSPKVLSTNDNQNQIKTEKEQRDAYIATRYNSVEQLQMLYEVRLKEIQSLKEELDKERKNSALLKDDLTHKMMIAEADKEGAVLSYKQTNELLAWSKNKSSDLEREVTTLKQNIVNLEKTRSENIKELEAARGMITDLQQRLAFLERSDGTKQTERQLENTIKSLQSKHLQEVTTLNHQLENYNSKLKQKDEEIKKLEDRLSDIQGKLGSLIVEKSETITVLMKDLEESQAQCRQLMASNISHDNLRLQQKLDDLIKEKEENSKTIDSLKSECNMLRNDLEQLESISHLGFTSASASDSVVQLGLTSKNGSNGVTDTTSKQQCYDSNLYLSDTNNRLKDELHRALLGQRTKRSEIKRLQEKLDRRENQISEMKKQERVYLAEVETLKSDMTKLLSELKINSNSSGHKNPNRSDAHIQTSLSFASEELESERKRIDIIEKEKEALKLKLTETEKLLLLAQEKLVSDKETKNNYLIEEEIEKMVKRQVEAKEVEHRVILEQKIKECNELKELYIQLRAEKDSLNKQLEVEKELNHDFSNRFKHFSSQIDVFKNEIKVKDELLSNYKTDKEQLESKLNKLQNSQSADRTQETISKEAECTRLKEEFISVSIQHKNEIDRLKNELKISEDRLIKSEKKLRADFTSEINKKEKEIDILNVLIQDKELKLKETLDNLNKYISIKKENKNVMTEENFLNCHELETKMLKDYEERLQKITEQHSKDLKSCEEESTKKIIAMEEVHKEALRTVVNQNKNEMLKSEEKQRSIISALKKQLIDQEHTLKANYIADLISAEEKVKDITVKYFAEEIKKIENRHRLELETVARQLNSSPVETLKSLLYDKENEIENLKLLKPKYLEAEKKLAALEKQIDMDRNNTAELMTRWAKEVQDLRSEMINKQAKMEEMKEKLKKLKRAALYFRQELILYKQSAATAIKKQQYKLLQELQDKIQHAFELDKKNEIKLMEEKYAIKEQELRKKLNQ
ncbi:uncharacterized protein LOC142330119 isoform X1 [Lycorma delicatula]|uniref:uncharacterized protein LOC142330119 isoform X1 n=1 Tax=Lycorma delicatula TaxID=130591 RepID=UPI003F50DED0